jgi:transcriptional regulator with PAS, ATPase and Fis domain
MGGDRMLVENLYFKDVDIIDKIISEKVPQIGQNATIQEITHLMMENQQDVVLIVERNDGKEIPIGFITATDVLKIHAGELTLDVLIDKFKEQTFCMIDEKEQLKDVVRKIKKHPWKYMPVIKNDKVVGIVKSEEFMKLYELYTKLLRKFSTGFENVLDNIQDAVCIVDKNAVVKFWNKSSEKLYQLKRSKILNKPISHFFPQALLPRVIKEGKPYENVYNSPRENCHIIISARPLIEDGEIVGGISSDRDISEMIELSELLNKTKTSLQVLKQEVSKIHENMHSFSKIVGKSPKIQEAVNLAKRVARSDISILLTGESGTGKEVFARAIHIESGRKGCFIPINCSAIPKDLLESELFGYESGAFTGALKKGKIGKFELAHEGTLFLDEIGDMPLDMQPKILRVLEDGVITRIGGDRSKKVDVRLIAASNKNLEKMIEEGRFRKDLYYRLNAIAIHLPPLRERKEDIPELINNFLKDFSIAYRVPIPDIPERILKILMNYDWEGNVRELKNVVESMVILSKSNPCIDESFLPDRILKASKKEYRRGSDSDLNLNAITENAEKNAIIKAMELAKGNKSKAAELLKIPRSTLYFKLKQYDILK